MLKLTLLIAFLGSVLAFDHKVMQFYKSGSAVNSNFFKLNWAFTSDLGLKTWYNGEPSRAPFAPVVTYTGDGTLF